MPISLGDREKEITDWLLDKSNNKLRKISFVNPYSFSLVVKQPLYADILNTFDLVLPDGIGIVWAANLLGLGNAVRASFDSTSLGRLVFSVSEKNNLSIAFVGAKPGVAESAVKIILKEYPALIVSFVQDGYGSHSEIVNRIYDKKPDIIVCGMGAPKQDEFLFDLNSKKWNGVAFTCGGYFDQLCEGFNYYPALIDKLNLRFLYRIYREPRRLITRYVKNYATFVAYVCKDYFFRKKWG